MNEIYLIGLGNPGKKYSQSRHNIGFVLLQSLSEKYNSSFFDHYLNENEKIINETDEKIEILRNQLNEIQEQSIQIRERKASSGATVEGLKKRKSDLIDRISPISSIATRSGGLNIGILSEVFK